MVLNDTVTKFDPSKVYIDLNESAFQSASRLVGFLRWFVGAREIFKTQADANRYVVKHLDMNLDGVIQSIESRFGDDIVFYYGVGDDDSEYVAATLKSGDPTFKTQNAFERNLKTQGTKKKKQSSKH
jgi:hypothetical protein